MKFHIPKDWTEKRAHLEEGLEIGAGSPTGGPAMSETPRTNEQIGFYGLEAETVPAYFARSLERELRAAQTQIDSLTKERDALRLCASDTSDLSNKQVHIESLQQQNEAMRMGLEEISSKCPHAVERAEGGISDYGGNADDMASAYRETAESDIGDIARSALSSPTTERFVRREVLEQAFTAMDAALQSGDRGMACAYLEGALTAAKAELSRTEGAKE